MRLFIAIQPTDMVREALCDVQKAFVRHGVTGNYVGRENLHLTLAFIGEYADADDVLDVIDAVQFSPFELVLNGIGAFDDVWWVGLEPSEPLAAYTKALRRALAEAGIPFDSKRFAPHITLVRRAVCGDKGMPGVQIPRAAMTVNRAALMRSDRGKAGMNYTEIF